MGDPKVPFLPPQNNVTAAGCEKLMHIIIYELRISCSIALCDSAFNLDDVDEGEEGEEDEEEGRRRRRTERRTTTTRTTTTTTTTTTTRKRTRGREKRNEKGGKEEVKQNNNKIIIFIKIFISNNKACSKTNYNRAI